MHFSFLINPNDNWYQAVEHCRHLAKQVCSADKLLAVFFYGNAVHIAQDAQEQAKWQAFCDCPLYICRTMIDKHHLSNLEVAAPFKIIGMAPWISIMEQADRIVEII